MQNLRRAHLNISSQKVAWFAAPAITGSNTDGIGNSSSNKNVPQHHAIGFALLGITAALSLAWTWQRWRAKSRHSGYIQIIQHSADAKLTASSMSDERSRLEHMDMCVNDEV